jgi:hypothetical protein
MVPRAMESIGKELRGLSVELKAMRNKVDEQDRGRDQAVDRLVEKIEHSFELLSARLGQRDPPPSA